MLGGTEPRKRVSLFDGSNANQHFQVGVPRGLRGASASLRVAGQLGPKGAKKEVKVPVRTYVIKVEAGARVKKAKELLRENARPVSQIDWHDQNQQEQQSSDEDAVVEDAFDPLDKATFRRDRLKRLGLGRRFPALINPTLFPTRAPKDRGVDGRKSPELGGSERLVLPTVSTASKKQAKKIPAEPIWKVGSSAEAQQLISNRVPVLFDGPYDTPRPLDSQEPPGQKDREPIALPSVRTQVQATDDATRQALEMEILANKQRGREASEALHARYDAKRNYFIKERDAQRQRRGCASPFDYARRRNLEQQQQHLEKLMPTNGSGSEKTPMTDLASRMSMGFARFRTHHDIPDIDE